MKVMIADASRVDLRSSVAQTEYAEDHVATAIIEQYYGLSILVWKGMVDGETACIFGLIPPTLLSDRGYLWLITSEIADQHKFLLVRHSQRVIELLLSRYPTLTGHCMRHDRRAIRWIKWLGGEFGEPDETKVAFEIRRRADG